MVRHLGLGSFVRIVLGGVFLPLAGAGALSASASAQSVGVSVDQFMQTEIPLSSSTSGRVFGMPTGYNQWQVSSYGARVVSDGMTHADASSGEQLATAGGRVVGAGPWLPSEHWQSHWLGSGFAVQNGATLWGSFLVQVPNAHEFESAAVGLKVWDANWANEEVLWIGQFGSMIKASRALVSGTFEETVGPVSSSGDEPTLVLFRVDSTPSGDGTVSVWLNPPLSGVLPAPAAVVNNWNMRSGIKATGLRLYGVGPSLDEVRLGPAAATVLPRRTFVWASCNGGGTGGGNGHRYDVVTSPSPVTWTQARDMAASMGGRLADLTSQAEHDFVSEHIIGLEEGWSFHPNEVNGVSQYRLFGPWIGGHREQSELYDHTEGWSWVGGAPWGFTSWDGMAGWTNFQPGYDRVCLSVPWTGSMPEWTITSETGADRVSSFVVEYDAALPNIPDVVITGSMPFMSGIVLTANPPSGSTQFQWTRGGVALQDGWNGSAMISGATTAQLTLQYTTPEELGEYRFEAVDGCGQAVSARALVRVDATTEPFLTCQTGRPGRFYRVWVNPSATSVTSDHARMIAASMTGRLAGDNDAQRVIDAMTHDRALWVTDPSFGPVGPWIGGRKSWGEPWRWADGSDISLANWNWSFNSPAAGWWQDASMHLASPSSPSVFTSWADLRPFEEIDGTRRLPNSFVIEWTSPFRLGGSMSVVDGDCGGTAALDAWVSVSGLAGTVVWRAPDGMPVVDGTTADGTIIRGQGTDRLEFEMLSPNDAGVYWADFMVAANFTHASSCGMELPQFDLRVGDCGVACPADFNQDGGVDGGDIDAFFVAWEGGDSAADVNQDGGVDGNDVDTFFVAWENGGC